MLLKKLPLISAAFLLTGCMVAGSPKHFNTVGLGRAAFDLECEQEKLKVIPVGGSSYGVKGCGKKAVYVLNGFEYFRNSGIEKADNKK